MDVQASFLERTSCSGGVVRVEPSGSWGLVSGGENCSGFGFPLEPKCLRDWETDVLSNSQHM